VSDIKRYKATGSEVVRTDPKGDLVLYIDYARLKAEVERLTKAGDAMEDAVIDNGLERMNEARDGWNAAKEGKDL
jgi:hypothetical protein